VSEIALAYYHILQAGGLGSGGTNFDAKLRRQSIEPDDLLIAHIGGMDVCARGLKAAAAMIEDGTMPDFVTDRYAGWQDPEAQAMLSGGRTLEQITERVLARDVNPAPRSGRQEYLENVVNRFV
jgi:xylose isomerase